jgi:flavin reductase (DIM6/NTAB) family NADH-FMN oxidoreductase RutF
MLFNTSQLSKGENYQLIVQGIVPRPIAWISTISKEGQSNLAPYSFFTAVSCNPPVLSVSQVTPANGQDKDTLTNLLETQECVINIVSHELAEKMNQTSASLAPSIDEFSYADIESTQSVGVKPRSVKGAKVRYECQLREVIRVSSLPSGGSIILLNVVNVYVQDDIYLGNKIDAQKLDAVGKLGGNDYSSIRDRFSLQRP